MASVTARLAETDTGSLIAELTEAFGDQVSTSAAVLERHGNDESYHKGEPPDAVVFARSTDDVSKAVKICAKFNAPIIAFGTGTALEGHITAPFGGVCIDVSEMNEIIKVNAEDLDVTVQAGVTRKQLNEYLRDTGLFFPIDPGADASLGGMAATRASGTNAVRYGTMRENVLNLTAVLADGRVIKTARRAKKSSAGYDLTRLFVGSEGTLGIITELTVKVYGVPEATSAAVCAFPSLEDAVNTTILTIQSGVPVARVELVSKEMMGACINYSKLEGFDVSDHLFFEFHGSEAGVKEQAETVQAIAADFGGENFKFATKQEDRNALWTARHNCHYATKSLRPGCEVWSTDVCVPISHLAEIIADAKTTMDEQGIVGTIVGHVGDGNFHIGYVVDPNNPEELAKAEEHNKQLVYKALAVDGTCTGEHGIGSGKRKFLEAEHGEAVSVMRMIKNALDPEGIMNPGKVLPA
ncbi:FAD-binding protein [Hwanghaeella grinnelliae]|uniref:D-lactate dehydrogenase (cytochrome) n=1 Tax=Hwanghaeella grinnelliae TaxID=2500179 RepID=A0A437QN44_9PROT|nr:FAD-linked oxidase C-terminal domain-containing protein [Hwanghaeella grinnelliae]RVU35917.1 FAD-binding protein [Hwanghaeella grinnelliae]